MQQTTLERSRMRLRSGEGITADMAFLLPRQFIGITESAPGQLWRGRPFNKVGEAGDKQYQRAARGDRHCDVHPRTLMLINASHRRTMRPLLVRGSAYPRWSNDSQR